MVTATLPHNLTSWLDGHGAPRRVLKLVGDQYFHVGNAGRYSSLCEACEFMQSNLRTFLRACASPPIYIHVVHNEETAWTRVRSHACMSWTVR